MAMTKTHDADYYQALTPREESDLERFISANDNYVTDAANLVASLRDNLETLEVANIHAIMSSEQQVEQLMSLMDHTLQQVDHLEQRVDMYDSFLANVEDAMSVMNDKDRVLTQSRTNEEKLAAELQQLLMCNTLPEAADPHTSGAAQSQPRADCCLFGGCAAARQAPSSGDFGWCYGSAGR